MGPFAIKIGTKHHWVKGIQVWSNEGYCFFFQGDNLYDEDENMTKFENPLLLNL